jgi:hypothetical protein
MTDGVALNPDAIYDDGALYVSFGLSAAALARARREGKLRYSRQGKRILYLGRWLIAWLEADGERRGVPGG